MLHILSHAQTWNPVDTPGISPDLALGSTIAFDKYNTPYIAFRDSDATNGRLTVMKYAGGSWSVVGNRMFTASGAFSPSITLDSNGLPYVAYGDYSVLSKASVMRFDGTNWVYVGSPGFTTDEIRTPDIKINKAGVPYVAFEDFAWSMHASVMKFNGTVWEYAGSPGFSSDQGISTSLALDKNDTPYIAFSEGLYFTHAAVMRFNGISWGYVGGTTFVYDVDNIHLALDTAGRPYVSYMWGIDADLDVQKFNGTSWEIVGTSPIFLGLAQQQSMAINRHNEPIVIYTDNAHITLSAKKFDGANWVNLGINSFSAGMVGVISIALDTAGIPYVAYDDFGHSRKTTVMKLDSFPAPITGSYSVCAAGTSTLSDTTAGGYWHSGNNSIAVVNSATGIVTGVGAGSTVISYTVSGSSAIYRVTVEPIPAVGTSYISRDADCVGSGWTYSNTAAGNYYSLNNAIATITLHGYIMGVSPGVDTVMFVASSLCGSDTAYYTYTVLNCGLGLTTGQEPSESGIYIFPNPTRGEFDLKIAAAGEEPATVIITNTLGEQIKTIMVDTNLETKIKLDVPTGIYFVTVLTSKEILMRKIMVE